jgi:hypothetical protein
MDTLTSKNTNMMETLADAGIYKLAKVSDGVPARSPSITVVDEPSFEIPAIVCSVRSPKLRNILPWKDQAVPLCTTAGDISLLGEKNQLLSAIPNTQITLRAENFVANKRSNEKAARDVLARAERTMLSKMGLKYE